MTLTIHTCAWCGREGVRDFVDDDGRTRCAKRVACERRVRRLRRGTIDDTIEEQKGDR